jgi:prepilin-type N-terminal cleavage/methylation domain-containing protein
MPLICTAPAAKARRFGFTLLEVLVAAAAAVLLMGALYVAIDMQLRHAEAGREVVEQSTLARALFAKIDTDIRQSLGPPVPTQTSSSSGSGAASSSTGASGTSATGASSSTTGSSTSSTNSSTGSSSSSTTSSTVSGAGIGPVQFNLWVQGDTNWMMIYISRFPRELNLNPGADPTMEPLVSDLRRVSYWLAGGGDSPSGLARQEVTAVTSSDAMSVVPPGIAGEDQMVIAEEVKSLTFSYFDGTNWQDSWDGTVPGPDGSTPVGPPMCIAITVGLATPNSPYNSNTDQPLKLYRHVVSLVTANGATQLTTTSSSTTGGATTP